MNQRSETDGEIKRVAKDKSMERIVNWMQQLILSLVPIMNCSLQNNIVNVAFKNNIIMALANPTHYLSMRK
jgi:hypothetical protein